MWFRKIEHEREAQGWISFLDPGGLLDHLSRWSWFVRCEVPGWWDSGGKEGRTGEVWRNLQIVVSEVFLVFLLSFLFVCFGCAMQLVGFLVP